jgi:signal transduction histidine kinase
VGRDPGGVEEILERAQDATERDSNATRATVRLRCRDDRLCVEITDDGPGGADERAGSGIAGIRRRVEAHDGTFALTSPVGGPTVLAVSLPCGW